MDQTVEINEDLAEKLTPNKDDAGIDTMERVKILEAIAEVCMHQGEYHLATKKFTQAGNKIKVCSPNITFYKCKHYIHMGFFQEDTFHKIHFMQKYSNSVILFWFIW